MKGLCQSILKWHQYFDLQWPYGDDEHRVTHINAHDVVQSIKDLKSGDGYDCPNQWTITQYIKHLGKQARHIMEQSRKWHQKATDNEKDQYKCRLYHEYAEDEFDLSIEVERKVKHLKALKLQGFKYVHEIGFGDNDGSVSGQGVGDIMDYEGRNINLNKEDFVIWTEQNR